MSNPAIEAIVIGASAGAVESLLKILPQLPPEYPLPILIVVHIPPDKKSVMSELMQMRCQMQVREAEDKEPIVPGTIYFAPPDYHMLVEVDKSIALSSDEPVLFSRPSIDVLFESAADAYGENLMAVILTGANADGANGAHAAGEAGGRVIVQNPDQAHAPTMPKMALAAWSQAEILTIDEIATSIQRVNMP